MTNHIVLALQEVQLPQGNLRGHTFHHIQLETTVAPTAQQVCPKSGNTSVAVFYMENLTASYIHFNFPSNPEVAAKLFIS